jgi:hypothetical protein
MLDDRLVRHRSFFASIGGSPRGTKSFGRSEAAALDADQHLNRLMYYDHARFRAHPPLEEAEHAASPEG